MRFASRSVMICIVLVLFAAIAPAADPPADMEVIKLINQYRKENELEALPVLAEMTKVAHTHLQDLIKNKPHEKTKDLNAWSDKGTWTPGIPGSAGQKSWTIMWRKPHEIAGWEGKGRGIELNYFAGSKETVKDAVEYWKKQQHTRNALLGQGPYKGTQCKGVGSASSKGFYLAWFMYGE